METETLYYYIEDVHCNSCGCLHNEEEPFTEGMYECLKLAQELYKSQPHGGALHVVLDDGNIDGDLSSYVNDDWLDDTGMNEQESELCKKIVSFMEDMNYEQRYGVINCLHKVPAFGF